MNNLIINAINKAIASNSTFYAYRLPSDRQCHFSVSNKKKLDTNKGFRIVPFNTADYKEVFIPEDINAHDFCVESSKQAEAPLMSIEAIQETSRDEYAREFNLCLDKLRKGELEKVVLSKVIKNNYDDINWGETFVRMTDTYHSAFVFMFNSPNTGAWAGASPETLARYHDFQFTTMALAGTRSAASDAEWGAKEMQEQEYVAQYIKNVFEEFRIPHNMSQKFSLQAGQVEHLCNLFNADIDSVAIADSIVKRLHPTPALCGLPASCAKHAIKQIERHPRSYYGGFIGPFTPKGFDYFVNLRSMTFSNHSQALFCGGGLTIDSEEENEWLETEAKAQTMMQTLCFNSPK